MTTHTRRVPARNTKAYFEHAAYIKKLAKHTWVPGMEPVDIESELTLRLLQAQLKFAGKNNASEATYVRAILFNTIRDLRRHAMRHPYITVHTPAHSRSE